MIKSKTLLLGVIIVSAVIITGIIFVFYPNNNHKDHQMNMKNNEGEILHYTCGMHPNVKVSPEEYKKGKVNCPICNMKLTPVYKEKTKKEESDKHKMADGEDFISRVKIKTEQAWLAGIKTAMVEKLYLHKEIRTVGKVAYDPELAIAEEEFISVLNAMDEISKTNVLDVKERTQKLIDSSRQKLRLLGLSERNIRSIQKTRKVHTNLILPEKKMWIYGDIYEYELGWAKTGSGIIVKTPSYPGEVFSGYISSISPVLDSKTRSIKFHAEVYNHGLKLKPEMYVDVLINNAYGGHMVLAVPKGAVLDTGIRKIVWVDKGNEEYEGRIVEVGPEAFADKGGKKIKYYPVLKGLKDGDIVVTKANFLIDSQSQLTGFSSSTYGGALGGDKKKKSAPPVHQH